MKTEAIIPFYETSPLVELPHKVPGPKAFTVTKLTVGCKMCGQKIDEPHGTKTDHAGCTDFILVAFCEPCNCCTQTRLRIYTDGRMLHQGEKGWRSFYPLTWVQRLLHSLFG